MRKTMGIALSKGSLPFGVGQLCGITMGSAGRGECSGCRGEENPYGQAEKRCRRVVFPAKRKSDELRCRCQEHETAHFAE